MPLEFHPSWIPIARGVNAQKRGAKRFPKRSSVGDTGGRPKVVGDLRCCRIRLRRLLLAVGLAMEFPVLFS